MMNPVNPIPSSCNGVVSSCCNIGEKHLSDVVPTYNVHRIGDCVVEPRDRYTAHVERHENHTGQEVNKGGIRAMTLQCRIWAPQIRHRVR